MNRDELRRQHDAATRQLQTMAIAHFRKALKRTLKKVSARIKGSLAASGSGVSLDDLALLKAYWESESDDDLLPFLEEVFGAGALAALVQVGAEGNPVLVSRKAQQFLAEAENRVKRFGDEMWGQARESLTEGFTLGEGVEALTGRLTDLFDVLDWQAERIARTEVMDAANQGSLAEMQALGELGPAIKCWLAELDASTDEDCVDLDGECVELDGEFSSGDDAPPIHPNCRCCLTYGDTPEQDVISATLDELAASGKGTLVPWHTVQNHSECGASKPWAVVKDADGSVEGCHATEADAQAQLAALYASENPKGSNMGKTRAAAAPPPPFPPAKPKPKPAVPAPAPGAPPPEHVPPYEVVANAEGCPPDATWGVVDANGTVCGCSATEAEAQEELAEYETPMAAIAEVFAEGIAPDIAAPGAFHSLMVIEGVETGDGRIFEAGALTWRDLPIPVKWQREEMPAHDGSVLVGRVDRIERQGAEIHSWGVLDVEGADGGEALRLITEKMLRGVSVDVDQVNDADVELVFPPESGGDGLDSLFAEPEQIIFHAGRVAGMTLTPMPAFQEAFIELTALAGTAPTGEGMSPVQPMQIELASPEEALGALDVLLRSETTDDERLALTAFRARLAPPPPPEPQMLDRLVASAIPTAPPSEWFDDPGLGGVTPLTVTSDGRVFGHAAPWGVCHTSYPGTCTTAPQGDDFGYFMTGEIETAEGEMVPVGQITMAGHFNQLSLKDAIAHYDNPAACRADVSTGEDEYGIWVAGALRPDTTPEQVRDLRCASLSGEWRRIGGKFRLIALAAVNVPGFPIPRMRARVENGLQTSLVAAGVIRRDRRPHADLSKVAQRVAASVGLDHKSRQAALAARVKQEV